MSGGGTENPEILGGEKREQVVGWLDESRVACPRRALQPVIC